MKPKQLLSKTLFTALFAAAVLFDDYAVFAQVKIGTSPTTIDPANNLEVQASNGAKTTSNKTTGQLTVTTPTDPVKFVGLQISTNVNNRALVVNPADGIVKYANAAPSLMLGAQVASNQDFLPGSFGATPSPSILSFSTGDITLNTGAATVSNNEFTIAETGIYDLYSHSNFFGTGTWNGNAMSVSLIIQKMAVGTSTWVGVSSSRTFYDNLSLGYAMTCQTSAIASLNKNDKLRVVIVRGNGGYLSGTVQVTASFAAGETPYSKSLKIVKLN